MPTQKRPFKVLDIGAGAGAIKVGRLAQEHPHTNFIGVELLEFTPRGLPRKNLQLFSQTNAIRFLKSLPARGLDHAYAHFTLQHNSISRRREMYRELMRVLPSGGRFAVIETGHWRSQLTHELRQAGFEVSSKMVSAQKIRRLGADNATMNAEAADTLLGRLDTIRRTEGDAKVEKAIRGDSRATFKKIKRGIERREGKPSKELREALKRIERDVHLNYQEKGFVVITARKRGKKPKSKKAAG